MKFLVIIEKGEHNLSAYVPDLPGCVSAGETFDETLKNIHEAIECHLELMRESGESIPEPTTAAAEVEIQVA